VATVFRFRDESDPNFSPLSTGPFVPQPHVRQEFAILRIVLEEPLADVRIKRLAVPVSKLKDLASISFRQRHFIPFCLWSRGVSLVRRQPIPAHCLRIVLRDTASGGVPDSEAVLRAGVALVRGQPVPAHRLRIVLRDTLA